MEHAPGRRPLADADGHRRYYPGKHGYCETPMDACMRQQMVDNERYAGRVP